MKLGFMLIFNSLCLGVGLAMDAFSVSLANGLNEPGMGKRKMAGIAGLFAICQGIMPLLGWICVHTVVQYFCAFERFIPWMALALLGWIGINMILESVKGQPQEQEYKGLGIRALLLQGIATSIDALSVGFTIAEYDFFSALICVVLIAAVTFVICFAGVAIGKKAGTGLAGKAGILGGAILLFIGLEIFISSWF